jgi:hypothetical protein
MDLYACAAWAALAILVGACTHREAVQFSPDDALLKSVACERLAYGR